MGVLAPLWNPHPAGEAREKTAGTLTVEMQQKQGDAPDLGPDGPAAKARPSETSVDPRTQKPQARRYVITDPLDAYRSRGWLTARQYAAGRRVSILWHHAQIQPMGRTVFVREPAGRSGENSHRDLRIIAARQELYAAMDALGADDQRLVAGICGYGHTLTDMLPRTDGAARILGAALDKLATWWRISR